jgi:hypothetical protein
MPTYLIYLENDQLIAETARQSDIDGTQKLFELPGGTVVLITEEVIEKWAREIAAEKLGDLLNPKYAHDEADVESEAYHLARARLKDFAPAGSKKSIDQSTE